MPTASGAGGLFREKETLSLRRKSYRIPRRSGGGNSCWLRFFSVPPPGPVVLSPLRYSHKQLRKGALGDTQTCPPTAPRRASQATLSPCGLAWLCSLMGPQPILYLHKLCPQCHPGVGAMCPPGEPTGQLHKRKSQRRASQGGSEGWVQASCC